MSNLQQRFLFGVPMAAIALGAVWAGGVWFLALVLVIGFFTLHEWLTITSDDNLKNAWSIPAVLAVSLAIALGAPKLGLAFALSPIVMLCAVALGVMCGLFFKPLRGMALLWPIIGILYIGMAMIGLVGLRGTSALGLTTICYLFLVVWGTDVMAYFTGRALGGPKLAPKISPGKTWSGAMGGAFFASILGGLVFSLTDVIGFWQGALGALLLSIISQLGDLFESWLKRRNGVKDASNLIPGHGGMFDRVDGLLPVAIIAYLLHMAVRAFAA